MTEYDNTNTVAVWKKKADAHEKAPDYRVNLNIEGRDLEISLWKNSGNPNAPILRGNIGEPFQAAGAGAVSNEADDFDF